jgi:signal transduction histidine kinase
VVEPFPWQRWWFRIAVLALFTGGIIAGVRYVSFRRLRQQLVRLEQETALQRDRARIAGDLHDDLGANLTQIALLSELAQKDFGKPDEARDHIDQIFRTAKALTRSLDEIVWAVNPKNDSLDRFVAHFCTYAPEYLHSAGIRCRLDVPMDVPPLPLPADVRHHLHLAMKEALHNVAKHAEASEVKVKLSL